MHTHAFSWPNTWNNVALCILNNFAHVGLKRNYFSIWYRGAASTNLRCAQLFKKLPRAKVDNTDIFKTPGKLTVEYCKKYCDLKCDDGSTSSNLAFSIKHNMTCLFIKNIGHQYFLNNITEERIHWTAPGRGDGITLLIAIFNKNAHRTRDNVVVAKT